MYVTVLIFCVPMTIAVISSSLVSKCQKLVICDLLEIHDLSLHCKAMSDLTKYPNSITFFSPSPVISLFDWIQVTLKFSVTINVTFAVTPSKQLVHLSWSCIGLMNPQNYFLLPWITGNMGQKCVFKWAKMKLQLRNRGKKKRENIVTWCIQRGRCSYGSLIYNACAVWLCICNFPRNRQSVDKSRCVPVYVYAVQIWKNTLAAGFCSLHTAGVSIDLRQQTWKTRGAG